MLRNMKIPVKFGESIQNVDISADQTVGDLRNEIIKLSDWKFCKLTFRTDIPIRGKGKYAIMPDAIIQTFDDFKKASIFPFETDKKYCIEATEDQKPVKPKPRQRYRKSEDGEFVKPKQFMYHDSDFPPLGK